MGSRRRRMILWGGAVGAAAFGSWLGLHALIRHQIAQEAARRHVDVTVERVRPGFFTVSLRGVHVRPEGVAGVEARADEVRVGVRLSLRPSEIVLSGVDVRIVGSINEVVDSVRRWRTGTSSNSGTTGRTGSSVEARSVSVRWIVPGEALPLLEGDGLTVSRTGEEQAIEAEHLRFHTGSIGGSLAAARVELGPKGDLRLARARSLELSYDTLPDKSRGNSSVDAKVDLVPPPLPVSLGSTTRRGAIARAAHGKSREPVGTSVPPVGSNADGPFITLPDPKAMRARLATAIGLVGPRLPDGSTIEVDGLSLRLGAKNPVGEGIVREPISLGPGPLKVTRQGDIVRLNFAASRPAPGATPLAIEARLPLQTGDVVLDLMGGPVPMSLLGVSEGAAGLVDVEKARVAGKGQLVLGAGGHSVQFDGELALNNVSFQRPKIAAETVRHVDVSVRGRGVLSDAGELRVQDAEAHVGHVVIQGRGVIEQTSDHFSADVSAEVPTSNCQSLLESVPEGLLPILVDVRLSGTLGAKGRLAFDSRKLDELTLDYQVDNRCRPTSVPEQLSKQRFSRPFFHRVVHPDGSVSEEETGPGTDRWADLDQISPFMQAAVLTTEDGAFFKHHGFNHSAIRNALVANLKARRFVRGASTITMQLAKNLFLGRQKTIARKIEEMVLTDYLEQAFSKEEMLELYLNIIEFGPDTYGVVAAADHYFGRRPDELNFAESLFLASLLPSPVRYHGIYDRGEVPETWMRHIHQLMGIAERTGKVTATELEEALRQPIVFRKADGLRPEPRPSLSKSRFEPEGEDDRDWVPMP